jgi:hypothetical protein
MKNITISIHDDAYRDARVWAAQRGISLSKVVAYLLEHLPAHPVANRRFPDAHQQSSSALPDNRRTRS